MMKRQHAVKRASFEIPTSLLYAIIVALLIIAFYSSISQVPKKETEKLYGPGGNAAAYVALKKVCGNWMSYIELCEKCDCTQCRDAFIQEFSVFSAYYVPYYVSASKLAISQPSPTVTPPPFTENPELSYDPQCTSGEGCTIKCAEALNAMNIPYQSTDPLGEIKKALYPTSDDAGVKSAASDLRKLLRNEYAEPCAQVCIWVSGRDQSCALGPEACAKGLPPAYQKLP